MYASLFLEEVKKKIDNEHLIGLFKEYLSKVDFDCKALQKIIQHNQDLLKYEDILISCHKIFMASQKMIDDLSCKDITPYTNRDMDIVMCYTFYSGIYMIFKSYLPDDLYKRVLEIYEDANLILNVPRDDVEENGMFFQILRKYVGEFFIPLRMGKNEIDIDEYDFAIFYLVKVQKVGNIPEYLVKKKGQKCTDVSILAGNVYDQTKLTIAKEIIDVIY